MSSLKARELSGYLPRRVEGGRLPHTSSGHVSAHPQSHHVFLQKVGKVTWRHLDERGRSQSGTLPRESASAVHLCLQQRRNISSLSKASAGLHHHLGGGGEVSRSPRRLTPTCAKFTEEEGTKAGHVTETCSGSSRKVEEKYPTSPSATADPRPEQNNRGGGGSDPGSLPAERFILPYQLHSLCYDTHTGFVYCDYGQHEASAGASAHSARPPLFCSTCQCGFSLPARSG